MIQAAVELGSAWTVRRAAPRRSSAGPSSAGARTRTPSPRCSRRPGVILAASTKRSTVSSRCATANASGTGVWATSLPRMFRSHATESGAVEDDRVDPVVRQELADLAPLVGGRPAGMLQIVGNDRARGAAAAGLPRSGPRGSRPREPGWPPPWRTRPGGAPRSRSCGATGRSPAGLPAADGGGATRWAGSPSRGDTRRRLQAPRPAPGGCTARPRRSPAASCAITARPADPVKPLIHPRRWARGGTYSP